MMSASIPADEPAAAGVPLLATKLNLPRWRPGQVSRPRLVARLAQAADRALTLISAPAGFGKTTLLAEWLATRPLGASGVAWVSLDPGDNEPALFWAYVITALRGVLPGTGGSALALLQASQPPAIESILATLINDLAASDSEVTLVLDDLHVIESRPIHAALAYLLDHLPAQLHLVVASRADPPLPLARLRARGELTELRVADLRFTPDEAVAFLNGAMGLNLAAADIAALEDRTEGWIAALQLAALSMRDHQDTAGFIQTFSGDHRYVVDYLVEEVLQRQPEPVRDFLLQTAILDRLSGPLCDAVTGQDDGSARLEDLERGNFFVVPLDNRRQWYRYHHLFADVLQARLLAERPEQMPTLHRRASDWFEQHGGAADAIRHALAAGDPAHAADLIEPAIPAMLRHRQESSALAWLRSLPDDLIRDRPVLSVLYASTLLGNGVLEGVEERLCDAERWLDMTSGPAEQPEQRPPAMVVVDEAAFRRLPESIALFRAGRALAMGEVATTELHARRVLDLAPEDDHLQRGAAAAILGLAAWTSGDLEAAYRSFAGGMDRLQRAGNISDAVGVVLALADIRVAQGRLHAAMNIYEHSLRLAADHGDPAMRGTADMYVGMSDLHRERNDLVAARHHLLRASDQGEHTGFPQYPYRWRVAMAHIAAAEGDLDGALTLLDEAERRYVSDFYPNVRPIAATKVRVWVAQGRLGDALDWARERGLSAGDEPAYLREYEHITLARVLLAQAATGQADYAISQAMGLLERLREAAESGGRTGSEIEILLLQAIAHQQHGDTAAALTPLTRALTLVEPEGYVRTFVDAGDAMRRLLRLDPDSVAGSYARRLLTAFVAPGTPSPAPDRTPATPAAAPLAEPLTAREVEILGLVAAGLRNQEIADQLFISLPTVKRHIANAYGKLGARHRTEEIARANALHLL